MVAQAYFDESYTEGAAHVLGGYIARAEDWARFSVEWEQLLPLTNLGTSNKRRFKMSEMARVMDRVPPFYEVIRTHLPFAISLVIDARDLENAKSRIWSDNTEIVWSNNDNIKAFLFKMFIATIYNALWDVPQLRDWVEPNEKIDIYFDENSIDEFVYEEWSKNLETYDEHIRDRIGSEPRFVNDEEFLPIQAADFWAWWVREGHEQGTLAEIKKGNFGSWQAEKMHGISMTMSEDEITKTLIALLKKGSVIPGLTNIYDEKLKPRTEHALDVFSLPKRKNVINFFSSKWKLLRKRLNRGTLNPS